MTAAGIKKDNLQEDICEEIQRAEFIIQFYC